MIDMSQMNMNDMACYSMEVHTGLQSTFNFSPCYVWVFLKENRDSGLLVNPGFRSVEYFDDKFKIIFQCLCKTYIMTS